MIHNLIYVSYMILCQFHFLPLITNYTTKSGILPTPAVFCQWIPTSKPKNQKKAIHLFNNPWRSVCFWQVFLATRDFFQPSPGAEDTATSCTSSECLGRCRGRVLDGMIWASKLNWGFKRMRWRSYRVNGSASKGYFNLFLLFFSLFLLIYSIYNWSPNKTCDSAAWQPLPNVCGDAPAKVHGATVKRWFSRGVMINQ